MQKKNFKNVKRTVPIFLAIGNSISRRTFAILLLFGKCVSHSRLTIDPLGRIPDPLLIYYESNLVALDGLLYRERPNTSFWMCRVVRPRPLISVSDGEPVYHILKFDSKNYTLIML